jgi:hypothetical protein
MKERKQKVIFVVEPQVRGDSHEKVDSGFLYALHLAFPEDAITLFAHPTHVLGLKNVFSHDGVSSGWLQYRPFSIGEPDTALGLVRFRGAMKRLLAEVLAHGRDKVFLLSFTACMLYIIKRLKRRPAFHGIKFCFVLHGGFEEIGPFNNKRIQPVRSAESVKAKFKNTSLVGSMSIIVAYLRLRLSYLLRYPFNRVMARAFPLKKMLLWENCRDYRYIAMSSHIITNARKCLGESNIDIRTVVMPIVFAPSRPPPQNSYLKLAVFGYGYPGMLEKLGAALGRRTIQSPYEIRVIGSVSRGTEKYPHFTAPNPGRRLTRKEMEEMLPDIDAFLVLYDRSLYILSCTGSILEALSYVKPVVHLDNENINTFNTEAAPIGIRCKDVEEMADRVQDIIEHYHDHKELFSMYRENILRLRRALEIGGRSHEIRKVFTW